MCNVEREKVAQVAARLRGPEGLTIKDRYYHLKRYHVCFVGSEAVDWLVNNGFASNREEAVKIGQNLLDLDLIHHVVDEHRFEDRALFYRFRQDDPPKLSPAGPTVASLKSECGTKSGTAYRKGWVKWSSCYMVLQQGGDILYEFRTELDSSPVKTYPLKDAGLKFDKNNKNCLVFSFPDIQLSALRLSFKSEEETLSWIKAFASSGVDTGQMEEDVNDQIKKAESISFFKAKDIDGNIVNLDRYKYPFVIYKLTQSIKQLLDEVDHDITNYQDPGLTQKNYTQLVELHSRYADKGLRILAFPCNQFGSQEPDPEPVIKQFAAGFNVRFDMFSKIQVNGTNALPLYKYLKNELKGTLGSFIKWNFAKFLCNRDGKPVKRYSPTVAPLDLAADIEELL